MNTRMAIAAAALITALFPCARAADLQLPSVAVGQRFEAQFTLTMPGGAPITGVEVALSVPSGCGQVQPDRVTTDSRGTGRFEFQAGTRAGVCTITGSSGGVSVSARTTVFRPEQVVVGGRVLADDVFWLPGQLLTVDLTFAADGAPLPLLPIAVGQFETPGPIVSGNGQLTTNAAGAATVRLTEGPVPGIYDLPLNIAGQTRHLRLRQGSFPLWSANTTTSQWVQRSVDPAIVTLPDGTTGGCSLSGATKSPVLASTLPPGTVEYFNNLIEVHLGCTGRSARFRIDYPDPIPADAQLWSHTFVAGTGWVFQRLPAEVAGNAVTFTVPELRDGGLWLEATVGLALPGTPPAPDAPRVQDMWWGGMPQNGWGVSIVQGPWNTFAAIFAYDDAGEPTWWVVTKGDWSTARGAQFTGAAYAPIGTPWFAYEPPITYVGDAAGRVQFRFADADNAEMGFTLRGVAGRMSLVRQAFGRPATAARPAVGGLWWGGASQSGWGISVLQQGDNLFSVWYTYDAANKPTWYVMPDGRWSSATTYEGGIYRTHGSPWLRGAYDPSQLAVTKVGTFTFDFRGTRGTFNYQLEGRSGTMPIERDLSY